MTALRAFEAAARLSSFTRAADELHVSQAAISHQIKVLESELKIELFHRLTRKVVLTPQGQDLFEGVKKAFDIIAATTGMARRDASERTLTVRVAPNFSAKWLISRIKYFQESHPDILLRLRHSHSADFVDGDVDVAVQWGRAQSPGIHAERLMGLQYAPMCIPRLISEHQIQAPRDLVRCPLLHCRDWSWSDWLSLAGIDDADLRKSPIIDDSNVLVHAVLDGQGIALCPTAFVSDYLNDGRLVRLFDISLSSEESFYILYPEAYGERPGVRVFRDWLLGEVRMSSRPPRPAARTAR